jgi:hypothetical protein
MKAIGIAALSLTLAISFGTANADPWDRDHQGDRKVEYKYNDGRC